MTLANVAALVLAAGSATRFGGGKVVADLNGRPLVGHVLARARDAGVRRTIMVLGRDAASVWGTIFAADPHALDDVLVAINPAPERGLASSLRLGLAAATAPPEPDGILILLGDQPRVRTEVIEAVAWAAAAAPAETVAIAPAYAGDAAPNPVLLLRPGWTLARELEGDRGLGPLLAADPARVVRVPVAGRNPDVDTPADLEALRR